MRNFLSSIFWDRTLNALLVVAIFWARVWCHRVVEDACFRMRVTPVFVLIRSLAYTKYGPGRLQRGSGVALN